MAESRFPHRQDKFTKNFKLLTCNKKYYII